MKSSKPHSEKPSESKKTTLGNLLEKGKKENTDQPAEEFISPIHPGQSRESLLNPKRLIKWESAKNPRPER